MADVTRFLEEAGIDFDVLEHARTERATDEAAALGVAPEEVAKTLVLVASSGTRQNLNDEIVIQFSQELDAGSVSLESLRVTDENGRRLSIRARSANDVSPETANVAAQGVPLCTPSRDRRPASVRRAGRFAGAAPLWPCARRTPSSSAQLTPFARAMLRRFRAKSGFRRRAGGVGSGIARFSQTTDEAAPSRSTGVGFTFFSAFAGVAL